MRYMVMECHLSYAVVLDEDGRFLNVANRRYEVGQTVTDVVKMQDSEPMIKARRKSNRKWLGSIAAMAACLALVTAAIFQLGAAPYASVYMTINPEIRIDVNSRDIVVDVEGINDDGKALVKDYNYKKKELDLVIDELVDIAIEMGFLHEGGQITLTLDADDGEWVVTKGDSLNTHLNEYLTGKLSVTIEITNEASENPGITIPVAPENNAPAANYSSSDYSNATSTPAADTPKPSQGHQNNYNDTDYGPSSDGVTDYNDTDYGPNSDGVTDYIDSTDNGNSNYGDNNYGDDDDDSGDSNYGGNGSSNYDDGDDD